MADKNSILENLINVLGYLPLVPPLANFDKFRAKDSPKAHDQIDAIIGQSYETDPNILSEQETLLNYLAGAVSEEETKNRYMYGIDDKELENRMSQIKSYPSTVDSYGVERFIIPLMVSGSFPPKYERESRSMQHWLEDYPEWINRSSINNP